ncbi:MAG: LacI family DNA-binding transcriptional regulator [Candidatus Caldatribacteriaceae bacterium]
MARLKDIAAKAGVSISTVSKFFRGVENVSPATQERIRQALSSLGYVDEWTQKKKGGLKVIGVVIPDIENPFFSSLVKSLEFLLFRYGYFLLLCNTENNPDLEDNFIHYLGRNKAKGVILVTSTSKERIKIFNTNIPLVLLDRNIQGVELPFVATNHYQGGKIATSYLLRRGRRRIAFLGGRREVNVYEERLKGYIEGLQENGLVVDPDLIVEGDFSFQGGYQAVDLLLGRGKSFDAIFAANDLIALGAIERLREKGMSIPQDVAIVGFDDIWLSRLSHPRLTTIRQPVYELCKEAVTVLLDLVDKGVRPSSRILEPQLVIRESC